MNKGWEELCAYMGMKYYGGLMEEGQFRIVQLSDLTRDWKLNAVFSMCESC